MITITIIGSDRYVVGEYSRDVTKKLASLLEVKQEEISDKELDDLLEDL